MSTRKRNVIIKYAFLEMRVNNIFFPKRNDCRRDAMEVYNFPRREKMCCVRGIDFSQKRKETYI